MSERGTTTEHQTQTKNWKLIVYTFLCAPDQDGLLDRVKTLPFYDHLGPSHLDSLSFPACMYKSLLYKRVEGHGFASTIYKPIHVHAAC